MANLNQKADEFIDFETQGQYVYGYGKINHHYGMLML